MKTVEAVRGGPGERHAERKTCSLSLTANGTIKRTECQVQTSGDPRSMWARVPQRSRSPPGARRRY